MKNKKNHLRLLETPNKKNRVMGSNLDIGSELTKEDELFAELVNSKEFVEIMESEPFKKLLKNKKVEEVVMALILNAFMSTFTEETETIEPLMNGFFEEEEENFFGEFEGFFDVVKKRENFEKGSYVFTVSFETGCYRHIQINNDATLEALGAAILSVFNFSNDHLHVFFMDNHPWSRNERMAFWSEMNGEQEQFSNEVLLGHFNFQKNDKFLYIFDFGDEWRFKIKVLREEKEILKAPLLLKSKGRAPEQYPDEDAF